MAGTIISTPSIGANDWSGWITQQGATDTGFMRVSLTNFSGTAASAIATGSVLECAGSIYSFSETAISLATGTASASVAVYFNVIPAAGGTTCTVTMNSTVPVWVDAKQGFYASAASLSRVIGGAYIGTAATYYNKYLYTGENLLYCLQADTTRPLLKKVVNIGEWDMDSDLSVDVPHGLSSNWKEIRSITAIIRNDPDSRYHVFCSFAVASDAALQHGIYIEDINLVLVRDPDGPFDGVDFDGTASTVANRGHIIIEYEA